MSPMVPSRYEWTALPWRDIQRRVFKLQTRIYRAQQRGDHKTVQRLQRLLVRSRAARLLAVRRVTQDNRGKRTAGIDGVKALTPRQRLALADRLRLRPKAQPTRRVWIPKPGSAEQRPLGIPILGDRAAQALLKLALEPAWEAVFEPNSYGFRPGRSAHDAIEALHDGTCHKPKFVLDADITKCFDRIDHAALLAKLHTTPSFRRVIRTWLKAGVMDGPRLFPTEAGTPQGGVISPLLANIALHGLEQAIIAGFPRWSRGPHKEYWQPTVVRYADDFVVLHPDRDVIEQARNLAAAWLRPLGLELSPTKTRIVHTLEAHDGQPPGFDFLGFTVRQYPVGKTHAGPKTRRQLTPAERGFTTRIHPSRAARRRHQAQLKQLIGRALPLPQAALISRLNPVIRGWASYYATVTSYEAFIAEDHYVFGRLLRWARRRHRNRPMGWTVPTYWRRETGRWTFATRGGVQLARHVHTQRRRHVKLKRDKSPYDGDWSYWATRLGRSPELPQRVATLLKQQRGRCAWCGLPFTSADHWEVDHRTPLSQGGTDERANQQLLHSHCHDEKTAQDLTHARALLTTSPITEEPDDAKVSRPVLQPSGGGDPVA